VVNVHHFADQIERYLAGNDFGMRISISDERDLLRETGGALRHARKLLEDKTRTPFLVHNVDIISNLDLVWFREHTPEDALATLLVSERSTQRYFLFDENMRLCGWTNLATGEVRSPYGAIDPEKYRKLAFAGIHNVSPGIFDVFESYGCPERFSIVDFYLRACAEYPIYGLVPEKFRLVDVGKFETLAEAERICSELGC